MDFCDGCNTCDPRAYRDEELGLAVLERHQDHGEPSLSRHPACLLLHTINEQESPNRFLPNYLLPAYEEVVNRPPTPPPPYSALQSGPPASSSPSSPEQAEGNPQAAQVNTPPAANDAVSQHPSTLEPEPPTAYIQREVTKPHVAIEQDSLDACAEELADPASSADKEGDCRKDLLKDLSAETFSEDKDKTPGRHRRFTITEYKSQVCREGSGRRIIVKMTSN
ncbi:UNVERIFIED_CONTAM: hypothetical protein FKN15_046105 [Acipenser sinensis]